MASSLPYVTAPGNIQKTLDGIKKAATPPKVTGDFVKTVLHITGGSGDQMTSFLKKIGFANTDGSPTELYTKFRNPSSSGRSVAAAIRKAYAPLYLRNEYMHQLGDDELVGLIMEETGQAHDSNTVGLIASSIRNLKQYADFSESIIEEKTPPSNVPIQLPSIPHERSARESGAIGFNLGYTINLNLPATTDIAVFNAIFKSLKENLLNSDDV